MSLCLGLSLCPEDRDKKSWGCCEEMQYAQHGVRYAAVVFGQQGVDISLHSCIPFICYFFMDLSLYRKILR